MNVKIILEEGAHSDEHVFDDKEISIFYVTYFKIFLPEIRNFCYKSSSAFGQVMLYEKTIADKQI